jgi:hypothetical protein
VLLAGLGAPPTLARMPMDEERPRGLMHTALLALWPPNLFVHDAGSLTLQITNIGQFGNPRNDNLNAGWRGAEYLFQSGLWVGAIGADSEAHVSTSIPSEFRPELDRRWTLYESFEGLKNGLRGDDDLDGEINEDFHNGFDDDGDGLIDEDYEAIGQQMFSCVYRDDTPEAIAGNADHYPLNLLIEQRSFQWATTGIDEFVGIDFEIINNGDQRLKDLYLAFFSDSDAGPPTAPSFWTDDLVGWAHIDTSVVDPNQSGPCSKVDLEIDTAFMWDARDNGTSITGGDVPGVFGSLFLGHSTDDTGIRAPQSVGLTTVAWFSSSGQNSDPRDDDERYRLISSGQKPRRNASKPDDYRYVIAAGPFAQLDPGESLVFQTAYVIGDGQIGFRQNAINAQRVFNGVYVDLDEDPNTGIEGKERCLRALEPGDEVRWDDPCDTLTTTINHRRPECLWVDADCNPCTGIEGREHLYNWVGTVAPPGPNLNTDPTLDPIRDPTLRAFLSPFRDKRIIIQWDNASELSADPITGLELFEGYRVWRADNWQRPEGSIGPTADEWMKVAEFRLHPDEAQQVASKHMREVTRREVRPVGLTDDGKEIYPIGRYQYEDTLGIINGKTYFYAVTAFGLLERKNSVTKEIEIIELSGQPTATEAEAVVPRWEATESGCSQVTVVPNPYRGGAGWDLIPADHDPTGSRIAFRDLPEAISTVRIYTLAGDLVQEAQHDGRGGDGTWFWNLVTRNGQNVTSGVYLFSVSVGSGEGAGEECRGRFVIIR